MRNHDVAVGEVCCIDEGGGGSIQREVGQMYSQPDTGLCGRLRICSAATPRRLPGRGQVLSDSKPIFDIVHQIGQKFSGISGTFGFFAAKTQFSQVRDLAMIIDGIARAYKGTDNADAISDQHWELLRESAVTLYLILQELREEQPSTRGLLDSAASLLLGYQEDETIRKLNSHSQAEIDRIFSSLVEDENLKVG
jgi:hypothetical protein